ncbi:hypothetical protein OHA25_60710 (plasmid) [Nonomuraea sp. NBC_00507]|uniref:hypothetical protein n=1 Tax=Nonomuraea sp. NBC_00507 TaxID=2976002 RepID=UPI002E1727C9
MDSVPCPAPRHAEQRTAGGAGAQRLVGVEEVALVRGLGDAILGGSPAAGAGGPLVSRLGLPGPRGAGRLAPMTRHGDEGGWARAGDTGGWAASVTGGMRHHPGGWIPSVGGGFRHMGGMRHMGGW